MVSIYVLLGLNNYSWYLPANKTSHYRNSLAEAQERGSPPLSSSFIFWLGNFSLMVSMPIVLYFRCPNQSQSTFREQFLNLEVSFESFKGL